jgi:hypothetical protein
VALAQRTDFGHMRWTRPKHALEGCQLQLVCSSRCVEIGASSTISKLNNYPTRYLLFIVGVTSSFNVVRYFFLFFIHLFVLQPPTE